MAKNELSHDLLMGKLMEIKRKQEALIRGILIENGRIIGGSIGNVTGENGHYCLESIFLDPDQKCGHSFDGLVPIVCHLNYPAFEVDVDLQWLSINECQQIIELLIKETQKA